MELSADRSRAGVGHSARRQLLGDRRGHRLRHRLSGFGPSVRGRCGFRRGGCRYPALREHRRSVFAGVSTWPRRVRRRFRFVTPKDFIWDDNEPVDLDGHGTHVAGTIGQLTNSGGGHAGGKIRLQRPPDAGQGDLGRLGTDLPGSPHVGTDDVVAQGIRYAADNGAKVIRALGIGRDGRPASAPVESVEDAGDPTVFIAVGKGWFVAFAGRGLSARGPATFRGPWARSRRRVEGAVSVAGDR